MSKDASCVRLNNNKICDCNIRLGGHLGRPSGVFEDLSTGEGGSQRT